MKRALIAVAVVAFSVNSCFQPDTKVQMALDKYEVVRVKIPESINEISDNGKEVLNLYRFASDEADKIFWDQNFGDKSLLDTLSRKEEHEYAMINYGPWDRIDGRAFVPGYGRRPLGANFYPADMSATEFDALADPLKNSPYSLIRRGEDGSLKAIPYHEAYKDNIDRIASYLVAAANITIKPSVRNYLLKKAEALKTDDYYASDLAWIEMNDSKMDLVIGPNETGDDMLHDTKASYGALVLLKDIPSTESLAKYTSMLPELQAMLPCEPEYKTFVPGGKSEVFDCDAIYYAGSYNAGFKVIAINLPYSPKVQAEAGTRTILFGNVIKEKFYRTVSPVGHLLINPEQARRMSPDAFYMETAFREIAHGLGVKQTVNGKGSVSEALGADAFTIEELKALTVGHYLAIQLGEKYEFDHFVQREDIMTTCLASLIRSARFGVEAATGKANVIFYNYLVSGGAVTRNRWTGIHAIDYARMEELIEELVGRVLEIQATGDAAGARDLIAEYAVIGESMTDDISAIRMEGIPIDIRFEFEK